MADTVQHIVLVLCLTAGFCLFTTVDGSTPSPPPNDQQNHPPQPPPSSSSSPEVCDLHLWYMDRLGEGVFDGELSPTRESIKKRIETLIERSSGTPGAGRISCATLKTFDNMLDLPRAAATLNEGGDNANVEHNSDGNEKDKDSTNDADNNSSSDVTNKSDAENSDSDVTSNSDAENSSSDVTNNSDAENSDSDVTSNSDAENSSSDVTNNSDAENSDSDVTSNSDAENSSSDVTNNSDAENSDSDVMCESDDVDCDVSRTNDVAQNISRTNEETVLQLQDLEEERKDSNDAENDNDSGVIKEGSVDDRSTEDEEDDDTGIKLYALHDDDDDEDDENDIEMIVIDSGDDDTDISEDPDNMETDNTDEENDNQQLDDKTRVDRKTIDDEKESDDEKSFDKPENDNTENKSSTDSHFNDKTKTVFASSPMCHKNSSQCILPDYLFYSIYSTGNQQDYSPSVYRQFDFESVCRMSSLSQNSEAFRTAGNSRVQCGYYSTFLGLENNKLNEDIIGFSLDCLESVCENASIFSSEPFYRNINERFQCLPNISHIYNVFLTSNFDNDSHQQVWTSSDEVLQNVNEQEDKADDNDNAEEDIESSDEDTETQAEIEEPSHVYKSSVDVDEAQEGETRSEQQREEDESDVTREKAHPANLHRQLDNDEETKVYKDETFNTLGLSSEAMSRIDLLLQLRSAEQESRMQSLELLVLRLEKELLLNKLQEQNGSTHLVQLHNQMLQMENELLRLNQSYWSLRQENDVLKTHQNKFLALEHKDRQNDCCPVNSSVSRELVQAQQNQMTALSELLHSQTAALQHLQSRSDQLEAQNQMLHQMVMNQSLLIGSLMERLQHVSDESSKARQETREIRSLVELHHASQRHIQSNLHTACQEKARSETKAADKDDGDNFKQHPDGLYFPNTKQTKDTDTNDENSDQASDSHSVTDDTAEPKKSNHTNDSERKPSETYLPKAEEAQDAVETKSFSKEPDENKRTEDDSSTKVMEELSKLLPVADEVLDVLHKPDTVLDVLHKPEEALDVLPKAEEAVDIVAKRAERTETEPGEQEQASRQTLPDKASSVSLPEADQGLDVVAAKEIDSQKNELEGLLPSVKASAKAEEAHDISVKDLKQKGENAKLPDNLAPIVVPSGEQAKDVNVKNRNISKESALPETTQPTNNKTETKTKNNTKVQSADQKETEQVTTKRREEEERSKNKKEKEEKIEEKKKKTNEEEEQAKNKKDKLEEETKKTEEEESKRKHEEAKKKQQNEKEKDQKKKTEEDERKKKQEAAKKKRLEEKEEKDLKKKMAEAEKRPLLYWTQDNRKPKDCYDLYAKAGEGRARNGAYKIFVKGLNLYVNVFCDMKNGGWTTVLKREDGSVDFYRNWKDYTDGFGTPFNEHYIGNEVLHYLTNQEHYVLQLDLKDWDGQSRTAHYRYFWIEDENNKFRLHVMGYNGTAGDGLGKHSGMAFSTHDADNDLLPEHAMGGSCAKRFHGAGWYYKCYSSNVFGVHYVDGIVPDKNFDGVAWKPWTGPSYSLKEVIMKIRPKDAT